MKRYILSIMFLWAVCSVAVLGRTEVPPTEQADYLLMVDVSGQSRNIYLEGIQDAIDTFYIAASRHDRLSTYNFAKSVVGVGDSVDTGFYAYCDLRQMMQSMLELIEQSASRYVRVFVLSDFHHSDSLHGNVSLETDSLLDLRNAFGSVCRDKDVQVFLMVLPPSTRYGGYSLYEIQKTIGTAFCTINPVTPDLSTHQFMLDQIDALNQLRGISDAPPAKGSMPLTIVVLTLMCVGILALCLSHRLHTSWAKG